jgi:hypothetical protein
MNRFTVFILPAAVAAFSCGLVLAWLAALFTGAFR